VLTFVLLLASAAWLYLRGVPEAAAWAADRVSPELEARLGREVLRALDRGTLGPSDVADDVQAEITRRFAALAQASAPDVPVTLVFRSEASGPEINAFALPGGTIVVLDGVVLLGTSDEVLGVLAHELGHQRAHHMTRAIFEGFGSVAIAG